MRDLDLLLVEHGYDLRSRGKAERSIENRTRNLTMFGAWLDAPCGFGGDDGGG